MSGKRRILIVAIALAALAAPTTSRATSVYGLNLLGERLEVGDARAIALGGSTQLLADSLAVLTLNPALLARLPKVTVGVTQVLALDEGRSTRFAERDISFTFSSFRVAFPLGRHVVFSLGYRGRYDPAGSFTTRGVTAAGDEFSDIFERSGGLFSLPLTLAANLTRYASAGVTFSFEQGFMQERQDIVFDDLTFASSSGIRKEEFDGKGYAAGLVLYPKDDLMIGGTWEGSIDYDTEITERFFRQSFLDTGFTSTAKLPSSASVAVSWQVSDQYLLAASAAFRDFGDFEGLSFPTSRLRREETYAFGAEYKRGIPIKGRRYPLRLSFNYEKLPFDQPVGFDIKKFLIGFGTGISLRGGGGKVDITFQAGKIGSISNNGLEDRVFRVYIGISGSELWKRRSGDF